MFGRRSENQKEKSADVLSPVKTTSNSAVTEIEQVQNLSPYLENTQKRKEEEAKDSPVTNRIKKQEYTITRNAIYKALIEAIDIRGLANADMNVARKEIRSFIQEIVLIKNIIIPQDIFENIITDICNDILGFGSLEPLLQRDDIADIMVNGAGKCYIETEGRIQLTNVQFTDNQQLMNICQRIVSQVGRRVDEANPICDARLLDGSRVNVIAPPLSLEGPTLTIRKFKKDKLRMSDLIKFGTINPEGGKILDIISNSRCNVLISGGTGSGKTTLLNCLTGFIENDERVITCEDSAELQLQQPHVVRLETRPPNLEGKGEVTMRDLVRNCLRMRPERIIVGEVRGPEAFDLLQAMNTGHDGSMGTLHANTPREAIGRIESMITMGGFALPTRTIREMIVAAVDVIIQVSRLRDGSRRIMSISEVAGMEGDVIVMQELLKYEIKGETAQGKIIGKHISTGVARPIFWERANYYNRGEELVTVLESMME